MMIMMMPSKLEIELVVARYAEDLHWLRRVPEKFQITIYQKGEEFVLPEGDSLTVTRLPNVGREAHSYLTHLVNYYDQLSMVTVFCQGRPFDHAPDFHDQLRLLAARSEEPKSFFWYGFLDESDDPFGRRLFVPWSKNPQRRELTTGRLYEELMGKPSPEIFCFRGGAQFAVTRDTVHRNPKKFYEQALRLSMEWPDAAHSFERFWDRIFGEAIINPVDLGPTGVRYTKRIRRLEEQEPMNISNDSI